MRELNSTDIIIPLIDNISKPYSHVENYFYWNSPEWFNVHIISPENSNCDLVESIPVSEDDLRMGPDDFYKNFLIYHVKRMCWQVAEVIEKKCLERGLNFFSYAGGFNYEESQRGIRYADSKTLGIANSQRHGLRILPALSEKPYYQMDNELECSIKPPFTVRKQFKRMQNSRKMYDIIISLRLYIDFTNVQSLSSY